MRKLFCKKVYEATDIYTAQHALGHSNVRVTEQYYKGYDHEEIDRLQKAINQEDKNLLYQQKEHERLQRELDEEAYFMNAIYDADGDVVDDYLQANPALAKRLRRKGLL